MSRERERLDFNRASAWHQCQRHMAARGGYIFTCGETGRYFWGQTFDQAAAAVRLASMRRTVAIEARSRS